MSRQYSNNSTGLERAKTHLEELRSPPKLDSRCHPSQEDFEQLVEGHLQTRSYIYASGDATTLPLRNLERLLDVTAVFLNKTKRWLRAIQVAFFDRIYLYRRTLFRELMPHFERGEPITPGLFRINLLGMEMFIEQLVASLGVNDPQTDIGLILTKNTQLLACKNSLRHIQKSLLLAINDF